jgi:hypothetical protein
MTRLLERSAGMLKDSAKQEVVGSATILADFLAHTTNKITIKVLVDSDFEVGTDHLSQPVFRVDVPRYEVEWLNLS